MSETDSPRLYDVKAGKHLAVPNDGAVSLESDDGSAAALGQVECEYERYYLNPTGALPTKLNGKSVRSRVPLEHRDIIQPGDALFLFLEHDDPVGSSVFAASQWVIHQLVDLATEFDAETEPGTRLDDGTMPVVELPGALKLDPKKEMIIGRDKKNADIVLDDVRVSRKHATIELFGKKARVADLRSANGTCVNGDRIDAPTTIVMGDRVSIGPYALVFTGDSLFPATRDGNAELVARNLRRTVINKKDGSPLVLLDDISLIIRPKEFVCILGPSGSGKTTLLNALSARVPCDEGAVLLNQEDLYANFETLKQNLTVVPQRDVVHDLLTVNDALWYTARLRLPPDTSDADIDQRISELIKSVGLERHRDIQLRTLSGGQSRRASLVNELLANPTLVFLDEVTSGLDEWTDCQMMELFREMAQQGKTIVCVTHSLSYVEGNCDLVVVLTVGGRLAFIGTPAEACAYFGVRRLG